MTGEAAPGAAAQPPYAGLTPDVVLDAVASIGLLPDGRQLTLNSYENRVYRLHLDDAPPVVAKFYRPGRWTDEQILEEHAFLTDLVEREVPAVAPVVTDGRTLHRYQDFRFSVFPSRGGRPPNLEDPSVMEWIGRFLGRIHSAGEAKPFRARPALNPQTFGFEPRDWLLANAGVPDDVREAWRTTVEQALATVERIWSEAPPRTLRLHGDCHAGNILWQDTRDVTGPVFLDFDDARSGPAVQDFWMLLSGEREMQTTQLSKLLAGYREFRAFDRAELRLVEPLRTLRLVHYSFWLASRWHDPAFPAAFPWFGTPRYWQDRILELREQQSLMDEAPIEPD